MDLVYVLKMVEMMLVTCSYIDSISLFRPLHVFFQDNPLIRDSDILSSVCL